VEYQVEADEHDQGLKEVERLFGPRVQDKLV
jgi:hypothetical protein